MVGYDMSVIGSRLGIVLRSYTGLGGVLVAFLIAVDEVAVLAADASAIRGVFLANSALCRLLVTVLAQGALDNSAESLCAALGKAAAAHAATSPTTSSTSSSTSTSHSSSTRATQPPSSASTLMPQV